jgi:hypothetical protein
MLILIEFVYHMAQLFTHQNAVRKNEEKYKGEVTMPEYIEREALLENLNKFAPECYNALVEHLIRKQPTADVAEVKHGKWIKAGCSEKDGNANCSECGHWDWSDCNYCSNCGAKNK